MDMEDRDSTARVPDRRRFFTKVGAIVLGGLASLGPILAAVPFILNPLRRKTTASGFTFVTTLHALPGDGVPRKFTIESDRVDAWTTYRKTPVGAVYLRRTGDGDVKALNVVCPHAGCFVNYASQQGKFLCPCHDSAFALSGAIDDPSSPSPRAMDELEVEIRDEREVWVHFKNFQPGHKERIPVA